MVCKLGGRYVRLLLYSDNMVLCADSVGDLQRQLNVLQQYCHEWGMKVNMDTSKVVLFRRGAGIRQDERWHFENYPMSVISHYKYLGIMFSQTFEWNMAMKTLVAQSVKALVNIKKLDIMYEAEVWGFENHEIIERVHVKFCKRILGVPNSTSNAAVLGECGRHQLYVVYLNKYVKFLLKIMNMDDGRLTKECYESSFSLSNVGRNTWYTNVKKPIV